MTMIPPRPNLIPEQLRAAIQEKLAGQPQRFSREQTAQFVAMLASNLERMLNDDERLPWVNASIEHSGDGFTLTVELLQPNVVDVEIV